MDNHAREWWTPLCTSILLGFDALNAPGAPEVCIIAATNHGDRLDPALIRPGRLGRVIEIKPPSAADLAVIFRQHLDDGEALVRERERQVVGDASGEVEFLVGEPAGLVRQEEE